MMPYCIEHFVIISLDNSLLPVSHKAITWTNAGF